MEERSSRRRNSPGAMIEVPTFGEAVEGAERKSSGIESFKLVEWSRIAAVPVTQAA